MGKLEVGDWNDETSAFWLWRAHTDLDCILLNKSSDADSSKLYVKSLHDNRHDLTAMARDEYYSKHEKQWPDNDRIDAIGQNGNNGEHYESKPVYTKEMHDNGELPPVGSEYLDEDSQLCVALCHVSTFVIGKMVEHVPISQYPVTSTSRGDRCRRKPIDTRTDEEKPTYTQQKSVLMEESLKCIIDHLSEFDVCGANGGCHKGCHAPSIERTPRATAKSKMDSYERP